MRINPENLTSLDQKVLADLLGQLPSATALCLSGIARCPRIGEKVVVSEACKGCGIIKSVDLVSASVLVGTTFERTLYYPVPFNGEDDYRTYKNSTYQDERKVLKDEYITLSFDNIVYYE